MKNLIFSLLLSISLGSVGQNFIFNQHNIISVDPCTCPVGYTNLNGVCTKIEETGSISEVSEFFDGSQSSAYGTNGVVIFKTFNSIGVGTIDTIFGQNVEYWTNTYPSDLTKGKLNNTGGWLSDYSNNAKVSFSFKIIIPYSKLYYVGIGSDNFTTLKIDGETIFSQEPYSISEILPPVSDGCFRYWLIYPIVIQAGAHILTVTGTNNNGPASVGVEIYNASKKELTETVNDAGLNNKILFSTSTYLYNYVYTRICPFEYTSISTDPVNGCVKFTNIPCP